jgi:hypothetical protein
MRNLKRKLVFAGALAIVMATGVSALSESIQFCGCRCPLVYAPVICDHGKTYPNPCVAQCHNAKNCVPTGGV